MSGFAKNKEALQESPPEDTTEALTGLSVKVQNELEIRYNEESLQRAQVMATRMKADVPPLQQQAQGFEAVLSENDAQHIDLVLLALMEEAPTDAEVPTEANDLRAYKGPEARYLKWNSETRSFVLDPKYFGDLLKLEEMRNNPKYEASTSPELAAFLEKVITAVKTYGGGNPENPGESPGIDGRSYALFEWNRDRYPHFRKEFAKVGRLAGIALLIPYTILVAVTAIAKKEPLSAAGIGAGLTYLLANAERILDPADKRRASDAKIVTDVTRQGDFASIPQGKWREITETFWSSAPKALQDYMNEEKYGRLPTKERKELKAEIIADLGPTFTDDETSTLGKLLDDGSLRRFFGKLRKTGDKDTRALVLDTLELRGKRA